MTVQFCILPLLHLPAEMPKTVQIFSFSPFIGEKYVSYIKGQKAENLLYLH